MDKQRVFSIIVAVIMMVSMVGFTAFYSFPDQQQGNPDNGTGGQTPTAIDFVAEAVPATVFQVLPSIKIQAETEETDVIALSSSIYAIEGVKRVNGKFEQWPYTMLGKGFVYVADISFDSDLNASHIIEKLESETSLQFVSGYKYALVELPRNVTMHSADESLALSRDYNFSESITEALVGLESIEEDIITVELSATFIGEEATSTMAFETENITATPVEKKAVLSAPVASLENALLFSAETGYGQLGSLGSLEQDLNKIEGVSGATVNVPQVPPSIKITSLEKADDASFSAFEEFLNSLGAKDVSLENQPLSGTVSFGVDMNSGAFLEKLSIVEEKAVELSLDALVEEEKGYLSGQLSLNSMDSAKTARELERVLAENGVSAEIGQPASLSITRVTDPDSGTIYETNTEAIQALLQPGHSVGEEAEVELSYSLVRGLFGSGYAEEKE